MTLPFALRSRIRLHDERPRPRALRLPSHALPIASYWAVMGLLTYGVSSGALRPERLAALHLVSAASFAGSRMPVEEPAPEDVVTPAPATAAPAPVGTASSNAEPAESAAPGPLAATTSLDAPASETQAEPVQPKAPVRPLSGFSLGSPIQDDDGDRGSYAALAATHAPPPEEAPREVPEEAPREARARAAANVLPPPVRDVAFPTPSEFQPASRSRVAVRAQEPRERALSVRRANPDDPYPGFRDDDVPAPTRPEEPKAPAREAPLQPRRERPPPAPRSVTSCEAAVASASEEMDFSKSHGAPATPDVTRGAYAALLEHGGYLLPCSVPAGTALDVCAAVRDGRAVGVTVVTRPADARVAACVRNAVAAMAFPKSPRLDVTRTRFDAARGR